MRFLSLSIAMLGGVLAAGPASGAVTTYTSYSLWTAAVSGYTNVTFDSAPMGYQNGSILNYAAGAYTPQGGSCSVSSDPTAVCFSKISFGSSSRNVQAAENPAPLNSGNNRVFFGASADNAANNYVLAALNTSTRAFAMDLYTISGGKTVTVTVYTNGVATPTSYNVNTATQTFFGLASDDPLDSVRMSIASGGDLQLDTFSFATALNVPEPPPPTTDSPESATLGYIGFGLIALVAGRKRFIQS